MPTMKLLGLTASLLMCTSAVAAMPHAAAPASLNVGAPPASAVAGSAQVSVKTHHGGDSESESETPAASQQPRGRRNSQKKPRKPRRARERRERKERKDTSDSGGDSEEDTDAELDAPVSAEGPSSEEDVEVEFGSGSDGPVGADAPESMMIEEPMSSEVDEDEYQEYDDPFEEMDWTGPGVGPVNAGQLEPWEISDDAGMPPTAGDMDMMPSMAFGDAASPADSPDSVTGLGEDGEGDDVYDDMLNEMMGPESAPEEVEIEVADDFHPDDSGFAEEAKPPEATSGSADAPEAFDEFEFNDGGFADADAPVATSGLSDDVSEIEMDSGAFDEGVDGADAPDGGPLSGVDGDDAAGGVVFFEESDSPASVVLGDEPSFEGMFELCIKGDSQFFGVANTVRANGVTVYKTAKDGGDSYRCELDEYAGGTDGFPSRSVEEDASGLGTAVQQMFPDNKDTQMNFMLDMIDLADPKNLDLPKDIMIADGGERMANIKKLSNACTQLLSTKC